MLPCTHLGAVFAFALIGSSFFLTFLTFFFRETHLFKNQLIWKLAVFTLSLAYWSCQEIPFSQCICPSLSFSTLALYHLLLFQMWSSGAGHVGDGFTGFLYFYPWSIVSKNSLSPVTPLTVEPIDHHRGWSLCVCLSSSLRSYPAVCDFLQHNNLLSVIRAHEAQDAG